MKRKLDTPSAARIDARCPADTGSRRRQGVAPPTGNANDHRRLRLTAASTAQSRQKSARAPLSRRGAPTFVQAVQDIVDDFPRNIPVAPRELDVIETYLGAFLDDALGTGSSA